PTRRPRSHHSYTLICEEPVKSVAWSVPLIAASATVPARAVSSDDEVTADIGQFVQVADQNWDNAYDTVFGVTSFAGQSSDPSGNQSRDTRDQATPVGFVASAGGTFTPGGTLQYNGVDGYGGAGLYVSMPKTSDGQWLPGRTLLSSGAVIEVEYRMTFTDDPPYEPITWVDGQTDEFPALPQGGNAQRAALNAADFEATFQTPTVTDSEWRGIQRVELTSDLLVDQTDVPYAQILTSHQPVYYTEHGPRSMQATMTLVSGTLIIEPEDRDRQVITVDGKTASAILSIDEEQSDPNDEQDTAEANG
uniref:hypothetical protein n=1 Tax=uncultured Kocuria sp. TaxID=259305 RepID=UPI002599FAF9